MSLRVVKGALTFVRQHAFLQLRRKSGAAATRCTGDRRSLSLRALPPPHASADIWTTHLSHRPHDTHSGQRCYSQRPDGPRSLQSLAEERRRQAEAEPSDALPWNHHRVRRNTESGDDTSAEQQQSAAQRPWGARAAQPSRYRASAPAEHDGDDSTSPAQPRSRAPQRTWTRRAAQPHYRRLVAEPAVEDGDEEDTKPDSQSSLCVPLAECLLLVLPLMMRKCRTSSSCHTRPRRTLTSTLTQL